MPPTFRAATLYPKIIWSGTELELHGLIGGPNGQAIGARALKPDRAAVRSDRIAQFTPRREVVLGHLEEAVTIGLTHVPGWKAKEIDRFIEEWGLPGKQFEFFLDRFQGASLEFEGTLKDQQGTAGTFTGTPSYEAASFGRGLRLDAGEFLDFPTAPASQQPSLIAGEGIIVIVVRPSFASNDALSHVFFTTRVGMTGRLELRSTGSNNINFELMDPALVSKAVNVNGSWGVNAELKIVGRWKTAADLEIWLNGIKGTTQSGNETLGTLGTNVRIGSLGGGSEEANGLYDRLIFFTKSFDLSSSIVQVLTDDFFPWWPNYMNKAELVDARVVPQRPFPMRELYELSLTVRKGVA